MFYASAFLYSTIGTIRKFAPLFISIMLEAFALPKDLILALRNLAPVHLLLSCSQFFLFLLLLLSQQTIPINKGVSDFDGIISRVLMKCSIYCSIGLDGISNFEQKGKKKRKKKFFFWVEN